MVDSIRIDARLYTVETDAYDSVCLVTHRRFDMSPSALIRIAKKLEGLHYKLESLVVRALAARGVKEEFPFAEGLPLVALEASAHDVRLRLETPRLKCHWGERIGSLEEAIRLKGWKPTGYQPPKVLAAVLVLVEDDLPAIADDIADEFMRSANT
jgi:hypothetical protein